MQLQGGLTAAARSAGSWSRSPDRGPPHLLTHFDRKLRHRELVQIEGQALQHYSIWANGGLETGGPPGGLRAADRPGIYPRDRPECGRRTGERGERGQDGASIQDGGRSTAGCANDGTSTSSALADPARLSYALRWPLRRAWRRSGHGSTAPAQGPTSAAPRWRP